MRLKGKVLGTFICMMLMLTQTAFGDIVVEKDAIGAGGLGLIALGALLMLAAVIGVI